MSASPKKVSQYTLILLVTLSLLSNSFLKDAIAGVSNKETPKWTESSEAEAKPKKKVKKKKKKVKRKAKKRLKKKYRRRGKRKKRRRKKRNLASQELKLTTKPSQFQVSAEILGAGLIYSVFGSFRPLPFLAANVGFSYLSVKSADTSSTLSASLIQIPLSASFLLGGQGSNLELIAGGDLVFASATGSTQTSAITIAGKETASSFLPTFGLGYRYWPKKGGFHFRATAYTILFNPGVLPWIGISLGYAIPG